MITVIAFVIVTLLVVPVVLAVLLGFGLIILTFIGLPLAAAIRFIRGKPV